ncbi:elongation factor G [bacterium]|nr:MAG: elongation factor G [bacterium]
MANPKMEKIRNFGIFAHIDAGKTTISERILYYTGRIHKIGEVHEGAAVMDWMKQEQERGITITAATTRVEWKGFDLHLIDTPGHVDFTVEVERSLRVLDGVVLVIDAVAGVQPQTETIWRQSVKYGVPKISFINKMDRTGADFERSMNTLADKLGARTAPLCWPMGAESSFLGVIDLLSAEELTWEEKTQGAEMNRREISPENLPLLEHGREKLLEALSDYDDSIAEVFLEGEWPGAEKVKASVRKLTIEAKIVPVLCGTALRNKGVQPLLDAVVDYLPSPAEARPVTGVHPKTGAEEIRKPKIDEPFCALAFKIQQDAGRKLTYIRVYSGSYHGGRLYNATRDKIEKPAAILGVHADKKERAEEAVAGDIIALTGLKWTMTGDTLCDQEHPLLLETIAFATPVISMAVEPKKTQDEDKMNEAFARIAEEDPTFRFGVDEETGQTIISGMGELHIEVVLSRMEEEFNVGVNVGKPQVVYKETVLGEGEGRVEFDRTLGDKRHAAAATVQVRAAGRGVGNSIEVDPSVDLRWPQFSRIIRAGVEEGLYSGPLGYPVEDVAVKVLSLEGEEGSISEMAVKVSVAQSLGEAMKKARPVQLEPLMEVKITVPEENLGEVIGDLNARRGEVQAVESLYNSAEITAFVSLRRMFGYSTDLRSATQGRGVFAMTFKRYDVSGG